MKPLSLRRTDPATTNIGTFGVEGDDVPIANVIAVIPFAYFSGSRTEIVEVA